MTGVVVEERSVLLRRLETGKCSSGRAKAAGCERAVMDVQTKRLEVVVAIVRRDQRSVELSHCVAGQERYYSFVVR
jgi:hypothetical protein